MSRSQGAASLRGRVALSDPENSVLEASTNVNLLAVRYPQVGLLLQATPQLALALVYRHKFVLELEQGFNIMADIGEAGQQPVVQNARLQEIARSVDLFQPWQLVAGAAVRLVPRLLISFDLTFSRWSEQPPPASNFTLNLDLGQFNDLVKLPPSRPYPDAGFHDTLMPAIGCEWRAIDRALGERLSLDLRAGYRYEPSPVPDQSGESNLGDADRHIFSLGVGLELARLTQVLPKPLSLDVFSALSYLPERQFHKLDARSPVGDFTVSGQVWQVGAQLRWRL
jgi:long-chain fatty acid transport protein